MSDIVLCITVGTNTSSYLSLIGSRRVCRSHSGFDQYIGSYLDSVIIYLNL
ncbi:hypothetical protein RchiOBHm_Chr4g0410461 [Rosa chinensis]|uniref:Uncharacterized protein n=1 Tax=Rosa chinensis TaxID=74649 RepID=A0A2P6QVD1_ROSCH|nr:hypothetical protein RchiOBHm_Chr4g0410461 [Rosa chinensis]